MTKRKAASTNAKPRNKTDQLKSLLVSPSGKTVEELSKKLVWQSHTTRAALTRLKQSGIEVQKLPPAEGSRQSRYQIAGAKK